LLLEDELGDHLRAAMRSGDATRRDTIRQLRGALHNETIALGRSLGLNEEAGVVQRLVNQHRDSIAEFRKGNRQDLVDKEQAELEVLLTYLPEQLDGAAISAAASAVIAEMGASGKQDHGKVMRELAPRLRGKADMRLVNEVVQELLR
jgi:uncharacterized protein YqeY